MGTLNNLMLLSSLSFLGMAIWFSASDFKPKEYHLPPPPQLIGPLAVSKPKVAERLLEGKILGPESIVVEKSNTLYTCTLDGKCLKIVNGEIQSTVPLTEHKNCNGERNTIPYCGRPLGIRRLNANQFVVADAVLGLLAIDFEKGTKELLVSITAVVEGKRLGFPDDLDIVDEDTILFSDLSAKYGYSDVHFAFLEHAQDGRLIEYKRSTGQLRVLIDGLVAANGVQVHPDKQSVLICETGMARIHRYYFAGPKKGRQHIFADNLPGIPDNIRLSSTGKSFFVALPSHRSKRMAHAFDKLGPWPMLRKFICQLLKMLPEAISNRLIHGGNYGIVVALDMEGKIIRSWHDPEGKVITQISEVADDGGEYLYLGSFLNNYIGRITKK